VALLSIVSFSVSGHPSAGSLPGVFIPVDVLHLVALSVWVGSFFAAVLVKTEEGVARLSQLATVAMPVAVVTGVAQALHLTGGLSNIFNSRYGTYLLLKVAIIGACLAIGFRLRLRMKSGQSTVTQLLSFEAVLLVVVIAVTALMVGTSPTATSASSTSFSSTQIQGDVVVDFSILPTRVGAAEVHVYLTPPGGSLAPVDNVEMSFTLPARGIPAIPVDLIEIGPNHWSGVMQFPYAGKWTLESRVSPKTNSTLLYTADVEISD
jgi:copper transport protein